MSLLDKFKTSSKLNTSYKQRVLEHLCDLLNTKREFGVIQKDYGLSNFSHFYADTSLLNVIAKDIQDCIERYEKRIEVIDIETSMKKSSFLVSFVLHCRIQNESKSLHLYFNPYQKVFHLEDKHDPS